MVDAPPHSKTWKLGTNLVVSYALLGSGLLLWLMVLTRVDVSIAYPLLSINNIIVMISAKWLFHENIPTYRWIGACAIIAGIYLMVAETV